MKNFVLVFFILGFAIQSASAQSDASVQFEDSTAIHLWDGTPPFAKNEGPERYQPDQGDNIIRLTNVTDPTITIYRLKQLKEIKGDRPAVVICPGGGYSILAMNLEGTEIAAWLGSLGITPVLLKYRVPGNRKGAFADAQRALSILRSRAGKFHIDPDRIGIMGFSAGGHLSARMVTHFTNRVYQPKDRYDRTDMRPDFGILIYPAYLVDKQNKLAEEVQVVDGDTPPVFIVQAEDDPIRYQNSLYFYQALYRHDVAAEMHLFAQGGHGYGLRVRDSNPLSEWPELCAAWLQSVGIIN